MSSTGKRTRGKQAAEMPPPPPKDTAPSAAAADDHDLILTSAKRRGVYECDYCHTDISQMPRIRCAKCADFDLCLDCFATTDHEAAIARLRASADAQAALEEEPTALPSNLQHEVTHGYRVCDSTRYPLFPAGRVSEEEETVPSLPPRTEEKVAEEKVSEEKAPEAKETTDAMEVDKEESTEPPPKEATEQPKVAEPKAEATDDTVSSLNLDDPKKFWTVEEDLRLLEGIKAHGLGNWNEISETVSGYGSVGKTPKRCMERYFDDYLGRYGHILPQQILEMEDIEEKETPADEDTGTDPTITPNRDMKRKAMLMRSPSALQLVPLVQRKKFKVTQTSSVPGYEDVWPEPYLPPNRYVSVGDEVGRDLAVKAEAEYVKKISSLDSKEEIEKVRKEWLETRLNKLGGPTVLPPLPDEVNKMEGAELGGFMPRRGDFDIEWENEAEQAIADMEFLPGEPEQDKELKIKVLQIYFAKQDERDRRKQFILSRKLYDYRKYQADDQKLPRDERDLVHRMRLFERFHTPEEHDVFIEDLLKAKRLRKEIAKLQMYRRMGISSLAEAERYELDKARRHFHRIAQLQKSSDQAKDHSQEQVSETISSSLWKQYRTSDRKGRRSLSRRGSSGSLIPSDSQDAVGQTITPETDTVPEQQEESQKEKNESTEKMDIDDEAKKDNEGETTMQDAEAEKEESKPKEESAQEKPDPLSGYPGFELLSTKEIGLCHKIGLKPQQYLEIKRALLNESLKSGLLDKDGPSSNKKTLVKIDVEQRGNVVDFFVQAGWISTKLATLAKELPQAPVQVQENA